MNAIVQNAYGTPAVLTLATVATPTVGEHDILVQIHASPVTQGDRRLRAADFPGVSAVPGRLMMGVLRPKNPIPGTMFAGRVTAVGAAVTRFVVGDDVFGSAPHSAYAEYLKVADDAPVAKIPPGVGYAEAAAVPYGAVTSLVCLRDLAPVRPGHRVLVLGAAGGVGRFAVQLARHLGAEVTGVCSARDFDRVRALGATHVIDHHTEDYTRSGERYDVVFDIPGVSSFGAARGSLTAEGRYVSLLVSLRLMWSVLVTSVTGGQRAVFGLAFGTQADMDEVAALVAQGVFRPVVDRTFPLENAGEAHTWLEVERPSGAVVLTVAAA